MRDLKSNKRTPQHTKESSIHTLHVTMACTQMAPPDMWPATYIGLSHWHVLRPRARGATGAHPPHNPAAAIILSQPTLEAMQTSAKTAPPAAPTGPKGWLAHARPSRKAAQTRPSIAPAPKQELPTASSTVPCVWLSTLPRPLATADEFAAPSKVRTSSSATMPTISTQQPFQRAAGSIGTHLRHSMRPSIRPTQRTDPEGARQGAYLVLLRRQLPTPLEQRTCDLDQKCRLHVSR